MKLIPINSRRESSNHIDCTFHIQFQDRQALALRLEDIGAEMCLLPRLHTSAPAKLTPRDVPQMFRCSVTFRAVADNIEDMGLFFVNQLSNRVDELLSSAHAEVVDPSRKSIIPAPLSQTKIVEVEVSCPKCHQPVVSSETASSIKKELDRAEKEQEFRRVAEEHQKKNPPTREKGFADDDFFKWFDLWLPTQPEANHSVLTGMAKAKISKLFRWSDRKTMLVELANKLNGTETTDA